MKKTLLVSLIINVFLFGFSSYCFFKMGGHTYIKNKFSKQSHPEFQFETAKYNTLRSIYEVMDNDTNEIIFLGNSITFNCDWNELLGFNNIKNRGIGSDVIAGVADRLNEVTESQPQKIFLMIGINDLSYGRSVDQILKDYEILTNRIKTESPDTKLYLQSILPVGTNNAISANDIIAVNSGIQQIAREYKATYINLFDLFKLDNNSLDMKYSFDGVHPNGQAYLLWKDAISRYISD